MLSRLHHEPWSDGFCACVLGLSNIRRRSMCLLQGFVLGVQRLLHFRQLALGRFGPSIDHLQCFTMCFLMRSGLFDLRIQFPFRIRELILGFLDPIVEFLQRLTMGFLKNNGLFDLRSQLPFDMFQLLLQCILQAVKLSESFGMLSSFQF